MKWEGHRQSEHVEDRRGGEGPAAGPRVGGRGIGIGTLVVALLAGWLFGVNPLTVLGLLGGGGAPGQDADRRGHAAGLKCAPTRLDAHAQGQRVETQLVIHALRLGARQRGQGEIGFAFGPGQLSAGQQHP